MDDKNLAERIADIISLNLRLVCKPNSECVECGEPQIYMVKPGNIEVISNKISEFVFTAMANGDIGILK